MVCEKFLLMHFKSGKTSVINFLGPLLMALHFLFMNAIYHYLSKSNNEILQYNDKDNDIASRKNLKCLARNMRLLFYLYIYYSYQKCTFHLAFF